MQPQEFVIFRDRKCFRSPSILLFYTFICLTNLFFIPQIIWSHYKFLYIKWVPAYANNTVKEMICGCSYHDKINTKVLCLVSDMLLCLLPNIFSKWQALWNKESDSKKLQQIKLFQKICHNLQYIFSLANY